MRQFVLLTLICVAFVGCARREEVSNAADSTSVETMPATPQDAQQAPQTSVQKVVAGVQVNVSLSPAAAAELTTKSETIVVEATYAGDPTPASSDQTDDFGLVRLGADSQELETAGRVRFEEDVIDKARLDLISGQPQLLINIRSGRKSTPSNLLACPLFWNSVEAASLKPVEIHCTLLSESPGG